MSSAELTPDATRRPLSGRRVRVGDLSLQLVAGTAAALATVLVGLIAWKVVDGARLSIGHFGLSFLWHQVWDPNRDEIGRAHV